MLSSSNNSSPRWMTALRLPREQIDPSHTESGGSVYESLQSLHARLWENAGPNKTSNTTTTSLSSADFERLPAAIELLQMPRAVLNERLQSLGILLLAPSLRQIISGAQLREVLDRFGPTIHLKIADRSHDSAAPVVVQQNAVHWQAVLHLGSNAALAVAALWLRLRIEPVSAGVWALARLRLPQSVLCEIELEHAERRWQCSHDGHSAQELAWFVSQFEHKTLHARDD